MHNVAKFLELLLQSSLEAVTIDQECVFESSIYIEFAAGQDQAGPHALLILHPVDIVFPDRYIVDPDQLQFGGIRAVAWLKMYPENSRSSSE